MKSSPFKRHDHVKYPEPHEANETGPVLNDHDSDDDWVWDEPKEVFDPNALANALKAAREEANKKVPTVNWMPGRSKELVEIGDKRKQDLSMEPRDFSKVPVHVAQK
jgi:hypothetical protein